MWQMQTFLVAAKPLTVAVCSLSFNMMQTRAPLRRKNFLEKVVVLWEEGGHLVCLLTRSRPSPVHYTASQRSRGGGGKKKRVHSAKISEKTEGGGKLWWTGSSVSTWIMSREEKEGLVAYPAKKKEKEKDAYGAVPGLSSVRPAKWWRRRWWRRRRWRWRLPLGKDSVWTSCVWSA